jgi:hypothetical protein
MASWEEQERESRELAALELQGDVAKGLNRIADALERLADEHRDISPALERLADAYLCVNQPEDEPSFEGQSLSDREHL